MWENTALFYLLSDHLGSTSITLNEAGDTRHGLVRYSSWGETRYTEGTTPTKRRYTGQYEEASLGIYYYGARWYDLREDASSARIHMYQKVKGCRVGIVTRM
jgi:hypothetical protein